MPTHDLIERARSLNARTADLLYGLTAVRARITSAPRVAVEDPDALKDGNPSATFEAQMYSELYTMDHLLQQLCAEVDVLMAFAPPDAPGMPMPAATAGSSRIR